MRGFTCFCSLFGLRRCAAPKADRDGFLNRSTDSRLGGVLQFTLQYRGPLPASSPSNSRPVEKNRLRKYFHPQLDNLWAQEPVLREARRLGFHGGFVKDGKIMHDQPLDVHPEMHLMLHVDGFWFVPLVTRRNGLACELNIKFMRPGAPGEIIKGGDLDNRIKTLFDGLRMPQSKDELRGLEPPADPNFQFLCLLDDDSLITALTISTEPLLSPETQSDSEVFLDIGVKLKALVLHLRSPAYLR
jgi:hypothetical protein